jgi:site-specific recombinase XerD
MYNYAKIILRTDAMKLDGTYPLCLRLTFSRKIKYISLKKSIPIYQWDNKNDCVRHTHPEASDLNLLLKTYLKRANDIILDYEIKHKPLSFLDFESAFKNNKTSSYYDFVEKQLGNNTLTQEYSEQSVRSYRAELTKLRKYKKDLNFNEITIPFLQSYEGFMRLKLENKVNTIHKSLKTMRTFLNKAIIENLIEENIFKKYKLRTEDGHREFLSETEIKELELLLQQPLSKIHKKILTIFLFACYTGLRYQDIKDLRYSDIHQGVIRIKMHKTKKIVTVPLIARASALMEPEGLPIQYIFNVPTNQVANRYLREVIAHTGITKEISFHCARHTFATLSLSLGIPLVVVSKLLGHSDIKTTQIYGKIVDTVKIKEMEKWNN